MSPESRLPSRLQLPRIPFSDVKWLSAFQPQRSDPDLRSVPLGFLAFIALGGALLLTPWACAPGHALAVIDAFFLSASAVCVTGLAPVNISETLSGFGHGVILLLLQLGGLGIVTASLALVMLGGKRLSLAHEGAVAATIGRLQRATPAELFRYSCLMVALCESAGAASLYWRLQALNPAADPLTLVWQAVFHAVSGFCNAGFSIFPEGLVAWRGDPVLLGIIDLLVIAGGIGLLSLINLRYYYFWRRDPRRRGRMALQTKLAAGVTLLLIGAGTGVTLLFEWNHAFSDEAVAQKFSWAVFHSVMCRTAGFNVVDPGQMHPATLLSGMVLMFVGGSPGSMAGGIKTVTLAVLYCAARAALLRQETVEMLGRRISPRAVGIALMLAMLALATVLLGIGCLMLTELGEPAAAVTGGWLGLMFEAFSAFGTTGLSTGVTSLLTLSGKLVVMALMFLGRVGPLVLAVYLARPVRPWHIRPPEEEVALG
ncbi:MAG: potassium transporter TrkH [Opitutae bacterium]|nr:potassium transporter TrkH [Opitutae bacterium]